MSEERNPTTENTAETSTENTITDEETTPVETPVVRAQAATEESVASADEQTDEASASDEPVDEPSAVEEAVDEAVAEQGIVAAEAEIDEAVAEASGVAEAAGEEVAEQATVAAEAQPTPESTPAEPAASPPVQPAAPGPTQTAGPKEYSPEYEVGGRSRRIHIEVRLHEVNYKNVALLGRFLDPRGRILSRRKTRVSAKAQRRVVNAIKLARHVALLPYTAEQTRIVRRRR